MSSLLPEKARKLLEEKNFAFIGTIANDGSPHVTQTWVDMDGEYVLINTAIGRAKEKNTRRDPRVWVAVADHSNPYNQVMIKGSVVERITGEVAESHIDKLAKKYTGLEKYGSRRPGERRIILKIKAQRVFF
jgi:PPOX class probable F420-dependent enzyme